MATVSSDGWLRAPCSANSCIEVLDQGASVYLRDSEYRDGSLLGVSKETWTAFIAGVKAGHFDATTETKKRPPLS